MDTMIDLSQLPRRPSAQTYAIEDILDMAQKGILRVPQFQTGLRWSGKEVAALFDSLLRGFPVGGLLLWQQDAAESRVKIGSITVDSPARADILQIVDGQQRISAIVGALLHPDKEPVGGIFALWVNLETLEFAVHHRPPEAPWLPLNIIGNRKALQHWARTVQWGEETERYVDRAFEIEERLIRYAITGYVVKDASEHALRLIFSRVNTAGVSLSEAQVFEALFGANSAGSKPLRALAQALHEATQFGLLSEAWLLRCVKAVGGFPAAATFSEEHPPESALLEKTQAALTKTLQFLMGDVGFFAIGLLPYRFPLIILARFFALYPEPDPRNRVLLTRWVWRGALSGEHRQSSYAEVEQHLRDIGVGEEDASVQRLLKRLKHQEAPAVNAGDKWHGRNAMTRIFATAILSFEPMDPISERVWSRDECIQLLAEKPLGQLFHAYLPQAGNPIAARVFMPVLGWKAKIKGASEEVLESLALPSTRLEAADAKQRAEIYEARVACLEVRVREMIADKAAYGENDRPAIAAILKRGA